jgi:hypothetical protein
MPSTLSHVIAYRAAWSSSLPSASGIGTVYVMAGDEVQRLNEPVLYPVWAGVSIRPMTGAIGAAGTAARGA